MLDVITRLLISIGILAGTTHWQWLSSAPFTQVSKTETSARTARLCLSKRETRIRACIA